METTLCRFSFGPIFETVQTGLRIYCADRMKK